MSRMASVFISKPEAAARFLNFSLRHRSWGGKRTAISVGLAFGFFMVMVYPLYTGPVSQIKLPLLMPAPVRIAERDVVRLVIPPGIFPVDVEASALGTGVREVP
jgi:hypothetical protein